MLDDPELEFKFSIRSTYNKDQNSDFSVLLRDQYDRVYSKGFTGDVTVASTNGNVTVQHAIIDQGDFYDGRFQNSFKRMEEGTEKLKITYNGETYYSGKFEIVDDGEDVSFSDLSSDNDSYEAVAYLVEEGVVAGYPDGTFKPGNTVSRVEALKFILEGVKENTSSGSLPFSDVSSREWYGDYLYTAHKKGIIDGYPNGTFNPAGTVNRAEFYKMLFNGMGVEVDDNLKEDPASDVSKDDWFAPYIAKAKELGIMDSGKMTIRPANGMSREEVAEAIYRLMTVVD